MTGGRTSAKRLRAIERRKQAWELRLAGHTYAEIGAELGVSSQRAHVYVTQVQAQTQQRCNEEAETLRALELERLDAVQMPLWDRVESGDLRAIDALLKIMDRRAKLLGLYAAPKAAVRVSETPAPCTGRNPRDMTSAERRAEIERLTAILGRHESSNSGST